MTGAVSDGVNVISWVNYDTGSTPPTTIMNDQSTQIIEFDIVFSDFSLPGIQTVAPLRWMCKTLPLTNLVIPYAPRPLGRYGH